MTKSDHLRESVSAQLTAATEADNDRRVASGLRRRSIEKIALEVWGRQEGEERDGYRYGKRVRPGIDRGWMSPDLLAPFASALGLTVDLHMVESCPRHDFTRRGCTSCVEVAAELSTGAGPGHRTADGLRASFSRQIRAAIEADGRGRSIDDIALAAWGRKKGGMVREAIKRGWWNPDDLADLACELGLEVSIVFRPK